MSLIVTYCRRFFLIGTPVLFLSLLSCEGIEVSKVYPYGALSTSAPIATDIGLDIFEKGGNAFDVAIAVGFALAVVHPEAGNLGGGGFALIRDAKTAQIKALDFRETAPSGASKDMYLDEAGAVVDSLSTFGAKAAGTPGTVAGLYALWEKHGTLKWTDLIGPAATLADTGFIVDSSLAAAFKEHREGLTSFNSTEKVFLPSGQLLSRGERWSQPDLARTLYLISANGPDGFYKGTVAPQIDSTMKSHGGLITTDDLENYNVVWREPIEFEFDDYKVYSMPPPSSGGITMGQILKLIETYDLSHDAPQSLEFIHLFTEAARLAFADRSVYLGDPDFVEIPDNMLSSSYLDARREQLNTTQAGKSEETVPGSSKGTESDETTHYSVCDSDGNMVAITYTINSSFGSYLVVDGAGFLLNNEMDDFVSKPGQPNIYGLVGGEANQIAPGKRMLSSMSPTLVLKNDQPRYALGASGGPKIITTVAEALLYLFRFGLSIEAVEKQPRFHHQWLPDRLYIEETGFEQALINQLKLFGHDVRTREAYSDLNIVAYDNAGQLSAASDPRKRGKAGGY